MTDEPLDRAKLTFEQAEGAVPLPRQLELQEVSPQLRAQLWQYIHDSIERSMRSGEYGLYIGGSWEAILRSMHVDHYHRMIDDYVSDWYVHRKWLRRVFQDGSYTDVLGFLQGVLRHRLQPSHNFSGDIDVCLARCRSAYRVVNGNTIAPVSSPEEKQTLELAFADLIIYRIQRSASAPEVGSRTCHRRRMGSLHSRKRQFGGGNSQVYRCKRERPPSSAGYAGEARHSARFAKGRISKVDATPATKRAYGTHWLFRELQRWTRPMRYSCLERVRRLFRIRSTRAEQRD